MILLALGTGGSGKDHVTDWCFLHISSHIYCFKTACPGQSMVGCWDFSLVNLEINPFLTFTCLYIGVDTFLGIPNLI